MNWEPTNSGNVGVLNDTDDFYRFFDATPQTEFLYGCVQRTVKHDLPGKVFFLERYDAFRRELNLVVNMPERLSDLLFRFLRRNDGSLSRRSREKKFAALTDDEATRIETVYREEAFRSAIRDNFKGRTEGLEELAVELLARGLSVRDI